jgi:hypothetical protein
VTLPELLREQETEMQPATEIEPDTGGDIPEDQPTGEVELDVLPGGAATDDDEGPDDPTTSNGTR